MPQPSTDFTLADQEQMMRAKNYFAWQGKLVLRELGQRVVEVGCGIGNFTELLLDREFVAAIDVEEACVERVRARYPGRKNLLVERCDAGTAAFAGLAAWRPDSCVCLNVLEHIEDDRAALATMSQILSPGGVVVLLVPAFEALYGPIDRRLGHYRRYTRRILAMLARSAGLEMKSARYMNTIGYVGWWMNSHVWKRDAQSDRQIAVFDRWVAPIMSQAEYLISPPFGQSLLAVLRKQG